MHEVPNTIRPTRLRIFTEDWWGEGTSFTIDGADNDGNYTESCWSGFPTLEAALAAAPEFVEAAKADGIVWEWDTARPKAARVVTPNQSLSE
jgi:hypothetical protein